MEFDGTLEQGACLQGALDGNKVILIELRTSVEQGSSYATGKIPKFILSNKPKLSE